MFDRAWKLPSYLFLIFCRFHVYNGGITIVMRHACKRVRSICNHVSETGPNEWLVRIGYFFLTEQNSLHFAEDIVKYISLNEHHYISIQMTLKFVPGGLIYSKSGLVLNDGLMLKICDKSLARPLLTKLFDAIWRHQFFHIYPNGVGPSVGTILTTKLYMYIYLYIFMIAPMVIDDFVWVIVSGWIVVLQSSWRDVATSRGTS